MVPPASRPPRGIRANTATGSVRIIGGRWRGSKLPVAAIEGLRPSADRVRETLFNWLQPMIHGAHVLDVFAGSGVLGLEAASRGAARVVLLERHAGLAANLTVQVGRLADASVHGSIQVVHDDALSWLARPPSERFDLAFMDPPFAADLWQPALRALDPWLSDRAWLYLEAPRQAAIDPGAAWSMHRHGQTREVEFALYRRHAVTLGSVSSEQGSARA